MTRIPQYVPTASLGEPTIPSPLRLAERAGQGLGYFVPVDSRIRNRVDAEVEPAPAFGREDYLFEAAGPRRHLFFDPRTVRAAIVTCGGLCPGLNAVIGSAVLELHFNYKVQEILGIRHGYRGLNPNVAEEPLHLTPHFVDSIHREGGTYLGSSRGPQPPEKMVDFLEARQINMLFTVGGDGTQRGAHAIAQEIATRRLPIAVVGVPKTIDNDIHYCDRTFGLVTAVEIATTCLHQAHAEAKAYDRCIGLVKVMGRDAGFIACLATLASQEVNFTLIPEVPFALRGPGGLLEALRHRLSQRRHAVIVVAEGAGQELFPSDHEARDASGNKLLQDIGVFLKEQITTYFREIGESVEIKYIDPSYLIRSSAPNTDDRLLCDRLARLAVHAAMAGKTDILIGYRNQHFIHVPIPLAVARKKKVDPESDLWAGVLASTGQPAHFR